MKPVPLRLHNYVRRQLIRLLLAIGLGCLPWPLVAQNKTEDWTTKPIAEIREAAEKGNPQAQLTLGDALLAGQNVPQNAAEAVKWFRRAAEQKQPRAQFALGVLYDSGQGVERDPVEAAKLYRAAADQGLAGAQYNLGVCYATGSGVPLNPAEAVKWYRKAAVQGEILSQTYLGLALREGAGVEKNLAESVLWLRRAALLDEPVAKYFLGLAYRDGAGVEKDVVHAAKWFSRAAEQDHVEAQYGYGLALLQGDGVELDVTAAATWFQKAAIKGFAPAQLRYGQLCLNGEGTTADSAEAVKWLRKAAEQGEMNAQLQLGLAYRQGRGVKADATEAVKWLQLAATQGHPSAQKILLEAPPAPAVAEKTPAEDKTAVLTRPRLDPALTSAPPTAINAPSHPDSPGELANPTATTNPEPPHFEYLIISMFLALAIAIVVGATLFSSFKARLTSLEKEIKAARYEVTRASTSLATILEMVEERLALAEQQRIAAVLDSGVQSAPQIATDAPAADPAAAEVSPETNLFKSHRTRPAPHTEGIEAHPIAPNIRTPKVSADDMHSA